MESTLANAVLVAFGIAIVALGVAIIVQRRSFNKQVDRLVRHGMVMIELLSERDGAISSLQQSLWEAFVNDLRDIARQVSSELQVQEDLMGKKHPFVLVRLPRSFSRPTESLACFVRFGDAVAGYHGASLDEPIAFSPKVGGPGFLRISELDVTARRDIMLILREEYEQAQAA
jgi:hypothetical protein